MTKLLFTANQEWDIPLIEKIWTAVDKVGRKDLKLDYYEPQIEIVSSDVMLDMYCITPDHKLLKKDLRWVAADNINVGDVVLGFDENCQDNRYRQYRNAEVLSKEYDYTEVFEVKLTTGKIFKVTGNHLWFIKPSHESGDQRVYWKATRDLKTIHDRYPTQVFKVSDVWEELHTKDIGWLAGLFDGEGYNVASGQKLGFSQKEGPVLNRALKLLTDLGVEYYLTKDRSGCTQVGIKGHILNRLKFLGQVRPERLISKVDFEEMSTLYATRYGFDQIVSVTSIGIQQIVKISTSTHTFVCDGYPMHNSSTGLPFMYDHWSFGKSYVQEKKQYESGHMNLAYELIINTDPAITYLLESNTVTMQAMTLCHAACGHSSFFKNNRVFKNWTDAQNIVTHLKYAKEYIKKCEDTYGPQEVERVLDACHALQNFGVDLYKRKPNKNVEQRIESWEQYYNFRLVNKLWDTTAEQDKVKNTIQNLKEGNVTAFPEENLLYFVEQYSPKLAGWKKEIVNIVRTIAQYFYPQSQTKVMNEGWASYIHYEMMNLLHTKGLIETGSFLEFLHSHTAVCNQPAFEDRGYYGINPYALGFGVFKDLERIIKTPTQEDKDWFPDIAGKGNYLDILKEVAFSHRDDSFLLQYVSPKLIRDFKFCNIQEKIKKDTRNGFDEYLLSVDATHSESDLLQIRDKLSKHFSRTRYVPHIEIVGVDWNGDRALQIHYIPEDSSRLNYVDMKRTLKYLEYLWGFPVTILYVTREGEVLDD